MCRSISGMPTSPTCHQQRETLQRLRPPMFCSDFKVTHTGDHAFLLEALSYNIRKVSSRVMRTIKGYTHCDTCLFRPMCSGVGIRLIHISVTDERYSKPSYVPKRPKSTGILYTELDLYRSKFTPIPHSILYTTFETYMSYTHSMSKAWSE